MSYHDISHLTIISHTCHRIILDSSTTQCPSPLTSSPSSGLGSRRSASTRRTSSASPMKSKVCLEAEQLPEIYNELNATGKMVS